VLPQTPISPNAYVPTDIALGYLGGILAGADKLSRVAWLQSDPAVAQVLSIEALPSRREGYTLDLDSSWRGSTLAGDNSALVT
jgi:hypothetical protein